MAKETEVKVEKSAIDNINFQTFSKVNPEDLIKGHILAANDVALVFFDPFGKLRWEWDEQKCKNVHKETIIAHELLGRVECSSSFSPNEKKAAHKLIGNAVFTALTYCAESNNTDDNVDWFLQSKEFVETKVIEYSYLSYLSTSILFIVVFCLFCFVLYFGSNKISHYLDITETSIYFRYFIIGAFCGGIGAFVSVLGRFKDININKYTSKKYISLTAVTRLLLGIIFGVIFVIAIKAGVIGGLKLNIFYISLFSFVSGFSEQFIPDLIEKLESTTKEPRKQEFKDKANDREVEKY